MTLCSLFIKIQLWETLLKKGDDCLKAIPVAKERKANCKPHKKSKTKPEKQLGITPKEGADDDNPAM